MFLFLDPGVTTGWALFDSQGNVLRIGMIKGLDNLVDFLTLTHEEGTPLEQIHYEPYILRNDKTRNMTRHQKKGHQDTLEVIGTIKTFGRLNKIEVVEINYVSLKAALAQSGLTMPSNHDQSHEIVASAYGIAHFIRAGKRKVNRRPV